MNENSFIKYNLSWKIIEFLKMLLVIKKILIKTYAMRWGRENIN